MSGVGAPRVKPADRLRGSDAEIGVGAKFGGGGSWGIKAARSAGVAAVKVGTAFLFLAACLTNKMGILNRSDKEFCSAATARSAPWLQRRGGGAVTFLHTIVLAA